MLKDSDWLRYIIVLSINCQRILHVTSLNVWFCLNNSQNKEGRSQHFNTVTQQWTSHFQFYGKLQVGSYSPLHLYVHLCFSLPRILVEQRAAAASLQRFCSQWAGGPPAGWVGPSVCAVESEVDGSVSETGLMERPVREKKKRHLQWLACARGLVLLPTKQLNTKNRHSLALFLHLSMSDGLTYTQAVCQTHTHTHTHAPPHSPSFPHSVENSTVTTSAPMTLECFLCVCFLSACVSM